MHPPAFDAQAACFTPDQWMKDTKDKSRLEAG
jgi:hypothetical protein